MDQKKLNSESHHLGGATAPVLSSAYDTCPSCRGYGLQTSCYTGEPDECSECGGDTVVRARDKRGRFTTVERVSQ